MEKQEQHIRDLLQRWTTGDITAQEETELLAAAEQDTFLREALAAYRAMPAQDHAASLASLRSKTSSQKVIKMRSIRRWSAVAASLLLLLTVGWWALDQQADLGLAPVAMEETATESREDVAPENADTFDAVSAAAEEKTVDDDNQAISATPAAPERNAKKRIPSTEEKESLIARDEDQVQANELLADQQKIEYLEDAALATERRSALPPALEIDTEAVVLQSREAEADNFVISSPPPPPPGSPIVAPSSAEPAASQPYSRISKDRTLTTNMGTQVPINGYRIVEGYIRDTEGYPLIGASILEENSVSGTVSDIDGFFSLAVPEATETLTVSYTGFETTIVDITAPGSLEIALPESLAVLDEVVVSGYSNQARQQSEEEIATARPSNGFRALRKYIEANTPTNTPKSRIKLQFYVQANGSLTNFTVLRSTSTAQNALAIALLEDGPKWEVTTGTAPVEVIYVIRF